MIERMDGMDRADAAAQVAAPRAQRDEGAGGAAEVVVEVGGVPLRSAAGVDDFDRLTRDPEKLSALDVGEHGR